MTRLTRTSAILVVVAAAAMAGCASGDLLTSRDLTHSVARNSCGLGDMPGFVIMLASHPVSFEDPPVGEYVTVFVGGSLQSLDGRTITIGQDFQAAMATLVVSPTKQFAATGGSIHITSVAADRIAGTMDLVFPDRQLMTRFSAPIEFLPIVLCG